MTSVKHVHRGTVRFIAIVQSGNRRSSQRGKKPSRLYSRQFLVRIKLSKFLKLHVNVVAREMPLCAANAFRIEIALSGRFNPTWNGVVMKMRGAGEARRLSAVSRKRASDKERERLILEHLPQVRLVARRIHERLPDSVNIEDLISTGIIGLIAAIDGFDAARNAKLKTYAEYKIRGAILDSLRSLDWAPRRQRQQYKQIERAIDTAQQRIHCAPSEEDVAKELNLTITEYRRWLVGIRGVNLGSLEASSREDGRSLLEQVASDQDQWPSTLAELSERQGLLGEAIERIPRAERTVIDLLYRKDMTLREIAKIVNLSESRVSQLKSQAILRLRSYMERCPVERSS